MAHNLTIQLQNVNLHKLNINYTKRGGILDEALGRSAHIQLIENETLMKMFVYRYWEVFAI